MSRSRTDVGFLPDVVVPAAIRAAEMVVCVVFLAASTGRGALQGRLTEWDANYYRDIADHGYPTRIVVAGGHLKEGARFAFSPLYPVVVSLPRHIGVSTRTALLIVAVVAGLAASVLVHLLGRRVGGSRRIGYIACALLGVLPMSITLQMGYAESLAIALSAAALINVVDRRWWWAAGFAFAAGVARPTAIVVALAIPVAAWGARRSVRWMTILAATLVGVAGAPLFWLYVWRRSGVLDGWFEVQKYGWHTHFDFGAETIHFFRIAARFTNVAMPVFATVTILAYILACVAILRRGSPPPLVIVTLAAVALALGSSNFWYSKPRLLLSAFPVVVLLARPLSRLPDRVVVVMIGVGVLASAWMGAYAVSVWRYAI